MWCNGQTLLDLKTCKIVAIKKYGSSFAWDCSIMIDEDGWEIKWDADKEPGRFMELYDKDGKVPGLPSVKDEQNRFHNENNQLPDPRGNQYIHTTLMNPPKYMVERYGEVFTGLIDNAKKIYNLSIPSDTPSKNE